MTRLGSTMLNPSGWPGRRPSCRVYLSANKIVTGTVFVDWEVAEWQFGGDFWAVGAPSNLVLPVQGYWTVLFQAAWDSAVQDGYRDLMINVAGRYLSQVRRIHVTGQRTFMQCATGPVWGAAGAILKAAVGEDSAGSPILVSGIDNTYLSLVNVSNV